MAKNELTILATGPFAPDAIDVVWGRHASVSAMAHAVIEKQWSDYMAEAAVSGRTLFNAPVTRLIGVSVANDRLTLTLGPTDYKTFVVTTLRDRPWFEQNAPEAMTPAVGNSVLLTHGDQALLGIRSQRIIAYGGRAHLIGGVLDLLGAEGLEQNVSGLLAHLRKEMLEEAGVVEAELSGAPTLLAVGRDEYLRQPELIWQWEISTDVEAAGRRLERGEHDGYEVVHRGGPVGALLQRMTPVAVAAVEFWKNQTR